MVVALCSTWQSWLGNGGGPRGEKKEKRNQFTENKTCKRKRSFIWPNELPTSISIPVLSQCLPVKRLPHT